MSNCKELSDDRLLTLSKKYGVPEQFIVALQTTQNPTEREQLCESIGRYFISAMCSFRVDPQDSEDVKVAARIE